MDFNLVEFLLSWLPTVFTALIVVGIYMATSKLLERQSNGQSDSSLLRTFTLFVIAITGFLFVVLAAPIPTEIKGQLTSLFGIIISASIALSSATFLGNALAGIMMRFVDSYKIGDFVKVGDIFGRVTEKGLFHTEIQSENRDLITVPNLQLANNAVNVTRASGTFITATCSLGYDVNHIKAKLALLESISDAGLDDGFVHVIELGDFSVVYKVYGLLKDAKAIISSRSKLHSCMLDSLHKADIEIVSPNFMNQRQVGETIFIPKKSKMTVEQQKFEQVEAVMFDKADEAVSIERSKENVANINDKIKVLEEVLKLAETDEDRASISSKIERYNNVKANLEKSVENKQEDFNASE